MTTMTVADYLKYANLQIAAEAFLLEGSQVLSGDDLKKALTRGNNHATRLTPTQANDFEAHWVVLDQCANMPSGFSGTLFQCYQDDPATGAKAGDIVVSFRSPVGWSEHRELQHLCASMRRTLGFAELTPTYVR